MTNTAPRPAIEPSPLRGPGGAPLVSPRTVRRAVAIAEAVFARDALPPDADRLRFVEREFEDVLARSGKQSRVMLSLMVWLVSLLAPLSIGRFASLRSMPLEERIRALSALERHFGEPLLAVKAMLCLLYYEHPSAALDVGFDAKCRLPRAPVGS